MSTLTNSIRPSAAGKSINRAGPAYSAYKLMGSCSRCMDRSYQTVATGHPIFKMACPTCKAYLDERKAARKLEAASVDKNSLPEAPKTP